MMKWYVMNVFNGKEKKVKENIEKELELTKMDKYVSQILIPKEKYYQVRNGKKIKAERNYMPGYMMIECDMNSELIRAIKSVNGVISFLGDGMPTPMKEKEVNRFLQKADELESKDTVLDHSFLVGQRVEIIDGPFATMSGVISEINAEKNKIMVDVNIFNRKTPVELKLEQVVNEE